MHFPYVNSDSREKCIEYIFHDCFQNGREKCIDMKPSKIYVKNFQHNVNYVFEIAKLQRERSVFCPGQFREEAGRRDDLEPSRGC